MGRGWLWGLLVLCGCGFDSGGGSGGGNSLGEDTSSEEGGSTPTGSSATASSTQTTTGPTTQSTSTQSGDPTSATMVTSDSDPSATTSSTEPATGGDTTTSPGEGSTGCVPSTEVCDGMDNDCDDKIDEHSDKNTTCDGCSSEVNRGWVYYFCRGDDVWDDARMRCQSRGAELVSILDATENEYVRANLDLLAPDHRKWIGYYSPTMDILAWEWSDGSPFGYENWEMGQPNNYLGTQWCVALHSTTGEWNDVDCDSLNGVDFQPDGFACKDTDP